MCPSIGFAGSAFPDPVQEFLKPLTDPEGKEKKLVESGSGSKVFSSFGYY